MRPITPQSHSFIEYIEMWVMGLGSVGVIGPGITGLPVIGWDIGSDKFSKIFEYYRTGSGWTGFENVIGP